MSGARLSYAEVATVLETLPTTVEVVTRMFNISRRELASRAGISPTAIHRLMHGHDISVANTVALLRALDRLAKGE
jgi:predicted transcriptional regulator